MKKFISKLLVIVTPILASAAWPQANAATITVFAAASLTDSLKESALADIFFSADEARMDGLEKKGLILKDSRKSRLSNSLVIVVADDGVLQIGSANDLMDAEVRRVALADPKTVPAGIYAKQYLERLKLWRAIEPKVVPTDNVR